MRRALLLLVGLGLLVLGLTGCTKKPVAVPCPAPAPRPEPKAEDVPRIAAAEEEAARKAAEDGRKKAEAPKPQPTSVPPTARPRIKRVTKAAPAQPPALPGNNAAPLVRSSVESSGRGAPVVCEGSTPSEPATMEGELVR